MGLSTIIKTKIGKKTLKNVTKWRIRKRLFFNFNTAKSILIVYDATSTEEHTSARFLCNYFIEKKIKCRCLGFLKPHEVADVTGGSRGFIYFTEKDFSLTGKPTSTQILDFCNTEFDILIDLHLNENYFIDAFVAFSLAHMKIGLKNNDRGFYDFMLQFNETVSAEKLVENIKFYLNQIKA